jgi:AraC-like DNA-binding protein
MGAYYQEYTTPAGLQAFVECLWTIRSDQPELHAVLPDACVDVIYSSDQGLRVIGTMSVRQDFIIEPHAELLGIRFHPGAAGRLVGCSFAELTDRAEPLESIWGCRASRLASELGNAATPALRLSALASAFRQPSLAKSPFEKALDLLRVSAGAAGLDYLADQCGLSPRQFRRRVAEATGVGPKHLVKVVRFRKAAGMAVSAACPDWAAIAAECGYFDQAHLIRDFRELGGCTPTNLLPRPAAA